MTKSHPTDAQGGPDVTVEAEEMVQIHLEQVGSHSWKSALFSAVIGAAGGPLYRFVAAAPHTDHDDTDHAVVGARFPLMPFQDLNEQADDDWANLARKRLHELDTELKSMGWRRRPERGPHWWSLRYQR